MEKVIVDIECVVPILFLRVGYSEFLKLSMLRLSFSNIYVISSLVISAANQLVNNLINVKGLY